MSGINAYSLHQPEQQAHHHFTVPVVFSPAKSAQFAYRVVTVAQDRESRLDEHRLNALGKEGWLLVSVLPRSGTGGSSNLDYLFVRVEP
ncbi:MAG: DUF4177 domain-containing protein [Chloroflexota bacterium]